MTNIYEWLFDHYALPKLQDIKSDHFAAEDAFSDRTNLSRKERLHLKDMISNMRLEWGVCAFALGVEFGLQLHSTSARTQKPGWLLNFLPQLDDPVS